jgi:hypothetical protein
MKIARAKGTAEFMNIATEAVIFLKNVMASLDRHNRRGGSNVVQISSQ